MPRVFLIETAAAHRVPYLFYFVDANDGLKYYNTLLSFLLL